MDVELNTLRTQFWCLLKFIHDTNQKNLYTRLLESVVIPPDVLSSLRKISKRILTSVLEPGPGGGDMVGGALPLDLDEDPHVGQAGADPLVKGGKQLRPVRGGGHIDSNRAAVLRRGLERIQNVNR